MTDPTIQVPLSARNIDRLVKLIRRERLRRERRIDPGFVPPAGEGDANVAMAAVWRSLEAEMSAALDRVQTTTPHG